MAIPMNKWIIQVRAIQCMHPGSIAENHTGKFSERDMPDYSSRNFEERGFTVGIGG